MTRQIDAEVCPLGQAIPQTGPAHCIQCVPMDPECDVTGSGDYSRRKSVAQIDEPGSGHALLSARRHSQRDAAQKIFGVQPPDCIIRHISIGESTLSARPPSLRKGAIAATQRAAGEQTDDLLAQCHEVRRTRPQRLSRATSAVRTRRRNVWPARGPQTPGRGKGCTRVHD